MRSCQAVCVADLGSSSHILTVEIGLDPDGRVCDLALSMIVPMHYQGANITPI